MISEEYVIDATMGCRDGLFCLCPIEGNINADFAVIIGLNLLLRKKPEQMQVVAIVHSDGQGAVEEFFQKYQLELDAFFGKASKENTHEN